MEVKGRNSYLVQVGNIVKHISGDCITLDKASQSEDISSNVPGSADENSEIQDLGQESMLEDDTMSVASDSTVNSIYGTARPQGLNRNHRNILRNRRKMLERLGRPPTQNTRLRSGN